MCNWKANRRPHIEGARPTKSQTDGWEVCGVTYSSCHIRTKEEQRTSLHTFCTLPEGFSPVDLLRNSICPLVAGGRGELA